MQKKYKRTIIAVRGDTQGGHAGGPLNPETEIPTLGTKDGKTVVEDVTKPALRPFQKKLWEWHEADRDKIGKLAGADPIVLLEMGDLTQGNVFRDDLGEVSLTAQVTISAYSMFPWLDMKQVRAAYMVRGTGVHVWGEGATETLLSMYLQTAYPRKKVKITDHWMLNVDGFLLDVAHHGTGPGIRAWTRGNEFNLYLKSLLLDDVVMGKRPPDMVLRAHRHTFTVGRAIYQTGGQAWELPGYITPPMCFIGSHAQKVERSPSHMSVGMVAFELINGRLTQTLPFLHTIDLRSMETV